MIDYHFLISFFAILIISIIVHEFTHAIVYQRITGKKIGIHFQLYPLGLYLLSPTKFEELTDEQYRLVLSAGIGMGFFVLVVLMEIVGYAWQVFLLVILLYAYGCKNDIKQIITTYKR